MEKQKSWEDFIEELDKPSPWWDEVYYWFYRLLEKIKDIPKEIRWFLQRGKRGYADCDVWNLSYYLADVISRSVKKLKKEIHGCPQEFFDASNKNECWKWEEILDKIANSFQMLRDIDDLSDTNPYDAEKTLEIRAEIEKKSREGLQLFVKHFEGLWD